MSYPTLLITLDTLRKEAPKEFKEYHPKPSDFEKINQARSSAYIHLFLKSRFGLLDFKERYKLISDGAQDGGVDAYYIDRDQRCIYLIQSKFRTTERNFEEKSIDVSELLRMEVSRISKGEELDSNGIHFSSKIKPFQSIVREIRDILLYDWKVIILANVKKINDEQMRRLVDNLDYEIIDHDKAYCDLVFPLLTGTYYKPDSIEIKINLGKKSHPQLNQEVETSIGFCNVRMIYVPVSEVARVTAKYKNSLLKYNPRNYLSLSRNEVNKSLRDTILNTSQNEFSLRNNGITILAKYSSVTDRTGAYGEGQLIIKDPQILNGGQTATTLAIMKEDNIGDAVFSSKEVLLKIIEIPNNKTDEELTQFIESISDATNKQSKIVEADRRSNDPSLLRLQKYSYQNFGLFLEHKRGEFQYGIDDKIIKKKQVIDRVDLLRALTAYDGQPARARSSEGKIFEEERFDELLENLEPDRVSKAYFCLVSIEEINNKKKSQGLSTIAYPANT